MTMAGHNACLIIVTCAMKGCAYSILSAGQSLLESPKHHGCSAYTKFPVPHLNVSKIVSSIFNDLYLSAGRFA